MSITVLILGGEGVVSGIPLAISPRARFGHLRAICAADRASSVSARPGQALARRKPLALWLDDVQRTGAATRDLVRYVVRRWSETRTSALVLLSARSEDLEADGELRRWLAGLERDAQCCRLTVHPLPPDEGSDRALAPGRTPGGMEGRTSGSVPLRRRRPPRIPAAGGHRRLRPAAPGSGIP